MTSKHTPGPWSANKDGEMISIDESGAAWLICENVVNAPDAHLISAAPEMYQALKDAEQFMSFMGSALPDVAEVSRKISAALAKAEGKQ